MSENKNNPIKAEKEKKKEEDKKIDSRTQPKNEDINAFAGEKGYKLLLLGAVSVFFGILTWLGFNYFFTAVSISSSVAVEGAAPIIIAGVFSFILFFVWWAWLGLIAVLVENRTDLLLIYFFSFASAAILGIFGIYIIELAVIPLFGIAYYAYRIEREKNKRIKVSPFILLKYGLSVALIFFLASVSLNYYKLIKFDYEAAGNYKTFISQGFANIINIYLEKKVAGYRPEMPVDDFLEEIIYHDTLSKYLFSENQGLIDRFKDLNIDPSELNEHAKADIVVKLKNDLSQQLDLELEPGDTVSGTMTVFIKKRINSLILPYEKYINYFRSLALFFVMFIFIPLYSIIIRIMGAIIFRLMLRLGFIKLEEREVRAIKVSL